MSFKYKENNNGERHSPCLTPRLQQNSPPSLLSNFTLDFTEEYIDFNIFKIFHANQV